MEPQNNSEQSRGDEGKSMIRLVEKKYQVDLRKRLGGGSYSEVYCACLKADPSVKMACKIISKEGIVNQINRGKGTPAEKTKLHQYIINRISSEVKIAQLIKHPNIVEFIDCAETKNNIYIFFEKCDRNLQNLIKKEGALAERLALPLIRDIITAACVLYDRNITHRDIKAQNILWKQGRAKLADFGFAKEMDRKDAQEEGTGVGTMLYMAPELIFQEKPQYSIKCDVWSIGVVIYYIIYGKVPWSQSLNIQQFRLCLKKPLDFEKGVAVSYRLKNLISAMMRFKDEERISIKNAKVQIDELLEEEELI